MVVQRAVTPPLSSTVSSILTPPTPAHLEGDLGMEPDLIRNECESSPAWGSSPPPSAWRANADWSAARLESGVVPRGAEDRALRSPLFGTSSGSWVPARLLRGELLQGEAGSTPARSAQVRFEQCAQWRNAHERPSEASAQGRNRTSDTGIFNPCWVADSARRILPRRARCATGVPSSRASGTPQLLLIPRWIEAGEPNSELIAIGSGRRGCVFPQEVLTIVREHH